jgi:hypothetical protein
MTKQEILELILTGKFSKLVTERERAHFHVEGEAYILDSEEYNLVVDITEEAMLYSIDINGVFEDAGQITLGV